MKSKPKFRKVFSDELSDYITAIAWSDDALFAISAAGELVQWSNGGNPWTRQDFSVATDSSQLAFQCHALSGLALSTDGRFLAACGQASTLFIWEKQHTEWTLVFTQEFGSQWLDQLAWHPTEPVLALGAGYKVFLWQVPEPDPLRVFEFEASTVLNLAWHPQGNFLAIGGHGGIKAWDIRDQQASSTFLQVPGASLCSAWSPGGKFLASGNLDRTLSVMDFGHPPPWLMQGFPSKVSSVAWAESATQGDLLATVASEGIIVWSQDAEKSWKNSVLKGHQSSIQAIAFQPQGTLLASASNEPFINLWARSKKLQQQLPGPPEGTHCLAWNHTGERLAIGGQDGMILVYDIAPEVRGFG